MILIHFWIIVHKKWTAADKQRRFPILLLNRINKIWKIRDYFPRDFKVISLFEDLFHANMINGQ